MKPISETDLEQLSAYIDGELHGSERRFFEKRLAADPGLRAACERAWLASTVLKAQPFRLMPESSAADICARCDLDETPGRGRRWALVASLAALTVAVGIGYRLWPDAQAPAPEAIELAAKSAARALPKPAGAAATVQSAPVVRRNLQRPQVADNAAPSATVAAGDPANFELNEATRSKTWPKRDQALDGYLVRHNQMTGSTGSDLISYAELLSEPDAAPEPQERP